MSKELLILADVEGAHAAAAKAYPTWEKVLRDLVPDAISVEHVGATSIEGCSTKGDLDIVVRVHADHFGGADAALATGLRRNLGSASSAEYSSFVDEGATPALGVQLVVAGGAFDFFHTFRDALVARPSLVAEYNKLKTVHAGKPMADYREAKAAFVARVLAPRPAK